MPKEPKSAGPVPALLLSPAADRFAAAGRGTPQVVVIGAIPRGENQAGIDLLSQLDEIGVTGFIHGTRYATEQEFAERIEPAAEILAVTAPE